MMYRRLIRPPLPVLGLLALTACQQDKVEPPKGPGDFALALTVTPAAGAGVQRISLPPAALVAFRRADLGDVRLYDANGRALALAFEDRAASAASQAHEFAALPIAGPQADDNGSSVSVRIEQGGQSVALDAAEAVVRSARLAVLLDTRELTDPAESVTFRAQLPKQVAVTVTVETSADLKVWDYLGDKVLYRPGDAPALLSTARLALQGADLHERYLRVSWPATPGFAVDGATVTTTRDRPPQRTAFATRGAVLADPHTLTFRLGLAAPIAAMRVSETGPDGVIPVRLLGRNAAEQPWTPLAATTLRQDGRPGLLELSGATMREYRLEADKRTAGFSAAPRVDLLLDPVTMLGAFNGVAPYKLALGHGAAAPSALPADQLAEPAKVPTLPVAQTGSGGVPPVIDLAPAVPDSPYAPRKLALWAALLLGAAVLAFAAIRLLRGNAEAAAG